MLNDQDSARLRRLIDDVQAFAMESTFTEVSAQFAGRWDADEVQRVLVFDHAAILVFPDGDDDVAELLRQAGFEVSAPVPSVVVRQRLADRYSVPDDILDVSIIRGSVQHASGGIRGVEVFALPRAGAEKASTQLIEQERERNTEGHLAFKVGAPETGNYELMRRLFHDHLSMWPDGGGYNPHDDAANGGRSVLYFSAPPVLGQPYRPHRLEITCSGHHPEVIAAHQRSTGGNAPDEHDALLSLLTGHWAARAVHVATELGLADVLHEQALNAAEIAERLDCRPDALARLLRYLGHLGVVSVDHGSRYSLSSMGSLLRTENPFHDLVRMYGNEFYEAWGDLLPAVRTGGSAFGHRYGVEHFDYFAEHPETSRTFDRSMAAVTNLVAGKICSAFDFPEDATVVDVGGGNGTLLRTILRENPTITGIVLDRAHVGSDISTDPADADIVAQLATLSGDFFAEVPGECDIYLLSRILHDWNDEDCGRILRVCREACPPDATLLVLERLLPDSGSTGVPDGASLALPWDMQMLAVTGGRERTRAEYEKLLAGANFQLDGIRPLPVDMNLLVARPV